jgi:multiple antibiotic resistance protein
MTLLSDNLAAIFAQTLVFFLLMDPIGNVPIFISVLKGLPPRRLNFIIFRELLIALGFIVSFYFIGEWLMKFLGISDYTLRISGGIILFLIALKMIFNDSDEEKSQKTSKEPFIVPLAVPLVAGPAILSAVMIGGQASNSHLVTLSAIVLAWAISTGILLLSSFLQKRLGERGLQACERLMGLVLILLSVQMFLDGVSYFTKACSS